jgi:SAM-dependent methyltransferase
VEARLAAYAATGIDRADGPGTVLEIGSGKPENGEYVYSMHRVFPDDNVRMSDIVPDFGHEVIDVTAMEFVEEFDAIICLSVLEHLPDPAAAVDAMHRALKPGGSVLIGVPFAYPLHDEPADYWRFTEHGLRLLTSGYAEVEVHRRGPRKLPSGLLAVARR